MLSRSTDSLISAAPEGLPCLTMARGRRAPSTEESSASTVVVGCSQTTRYAHQLQCEGEPALVTCLRITSERVAGNLMHCCRQRGPGRSGPEPSKVGVAVEAALAPLKQRAHAQSPKSGKAAKQMNTALQPLFKDHSRNAIKGYLWSNVHYCLRDGTFHDTRSGLSQHLASGKTVARSTAKQLPNAKLLLRKMDSRV